MILVDHELRARGPELLDPWDSGMVQPASIDLLLGRNFRMFRRRTLASIDLAKIPDADETSEAVSVPLYVRTCGMCGGSGIDDDLRNVCSRCGGTCQSRHEEGRFVIHPGEMVLGSTLERITVPLDLGMQLTGKSSLARVGLIPHVEAGWFDPGWEGVGTLEIANLGATPIILRPGLKICQSRWMRLSSPPAHAYGSAQAGSHYQGGNTAEGIASDWHTKRPKP